MLGNSVSDVANNVGQACECYKKLELLGIPIYINEENDEYAEGAKIFTCENAFRLPGVIKINESITEYPNIEENELFIVFQLMAQVFPSLGDYEINILSFWILDVFIEGLWTAQNAKLDHVHQRATLEWIAYFFNYIQKNNPTRKELFKHLKSVLFLPEESKLRDGIESEGEKSTTQSIKTEKNYDTLSEKTSIVKSIKGIWNLPMPPQEDKKVELEIDEDSSYFSSTTFDEESPKSWNSVEDHAESISDRNVKHMEVILEILYRIFARRWVYSEIRKAFHAMPTVEVVDLPFTLNLPKPQLPSFSSLFKTGKDSVGLSLTERLPEDTHAEKELHKNDYILPLQESEEAKSYLKQLFGLSYSERSLPSKGGEGKRKK